MMSTCGVRPNSIHFLFDSSVHVMGVRCERREHVKWYVFYDWILFSMKICEKFWLEVSEYGHSSELVGILTTWKIVRQEKLHRNGDFWKIGKNAWEKSENVSRLEHVWAFSRYSKIIIYMEFFKPIHFLEQHYDDRSHERSRKPPP